MSAFIFERRTPRQLRFLPAATIRGNGKGGYAHRPLRNHDENAERVNEVMSVLREAMKLKPLSLKEAYDIAVNTAPLKMRNVSFSARQSNGRPPMLTVRS